jgi:nucleobase:cation symporter-1, NCS1 family
VNPAAVIATPVGAAIAVIPVLAPGMTDVAQYSWFNGVGVALVGYLLLARRSAVTASSLRP